MTRYSKAEFRPARERIAALPEDRRRKIEDGGREIVEAAHLAEIRKSLNLTQSALAALTGIKQGELSRIETHTSAIQLRTLQKYVSGLGGKMKIVVDLPDGTFAEIPVEHGRPVKSRLSVGHATTRE